MSNNLMTVEELAHEYDISVSSITTNFPRVQKSLFKKYGVSIERQGRGNNARYYIKDFSHSDPTRAVTLYQSMEKNLMPVEITAGLLDINFLVFIGIVSSPQRGFRGNYQDLLSYLDLDISEKNITIMRESLRYLQQQSYIMYMEDDTNPLYFMAGIKHATEKKMELEINAILHFKNLVANTRKSWIPVMKTYLALHIVQQPCTIKEIVEITHLTEYKVRDCLSILEKDNIIIKEKVNIKDHLTGSVYCLGSNVCINAFGIES